VPGNLIVLGGDGAAPAPSNDKGKKGVDVPGDLIVLGGDGAAPALDAAVGRQAVHAGPAHGEGQHPRPVGAPLPAALRQHPDTTVAEAHPQAGANHRQAGDARAQILCAAIMDFFMVCSRFLPHKTNAVGSFQRFKESVGGTKKKCR